MSAATVTTGALTRPAVRRPARASVAGPLTRPAPARPRSVPGAPGRDRHFAAATSVQSCTITRPAMATEGPSDRSLLAIMVAVSAIFLVGLVVVVQGFWAVSSAPEASAHSEVGVVSTR